MDLRFDVIPMSSVIKCIKSDNYPNNGVIYRIFDYSVDERSKPHLEFFLSIKNTLQPSPRSKGSTEIRIGFDIENGTFFSSKRGTGNSFVVVEFAETEYITLLLYYIIRYCEEYEFIFYDEEVTTNPNLPTYGELIGKILSCSTACVTEKLEDRSLDVLKSNYCTFVNSRNFKTERESKIKEFLDTIENTDELDLATVPNINSITTFIMKVTIRELFYIGPTSVHIILIKYFEFLISEFINNNEDYKKKLLSPMKKGEIYDSMICKPLTITYDHYLSRLCTIIDVRYQTPILSLY